MTVEELIDAAARKVSIIEAGGGLSSDEQTDALETLNALIDSWNAEPGAIVKQTRFPLTLTGAASYSISPRPLRVLSAFATHIGGASAPVEVCTPARWAELAASRGITDLWPKGLLCDYGYPSATIYVAPLSVGLLELVVELPAFTEYASVDDVVTLAPGFRRALMFNLAVELAAEYGRPLPESVAAIAASSKASLGNLNLANHGNAPAPAA